MTREMCMGHTAEYSVRTGLIKGHFLYPQATAKSFVF